MHEAENNMGAESIAGVISPKIPLSTLDKTYQSLYINIPFCRSKCLFCDYVHLIPTHDLLLSSEDSKRQKYIDALCREIKFRGKESSLENTIPYTLYWGGGTASILEKNEILQIMGTIKNSFDFGGMVESTMECSPDSIDQDKVKLFREVGFNRVSVGAQSFDNERLKNLGRRHTSEQVYEAVSFAREAGFSDINVDLMCSFPNETIEEVRYNVLEAIKLKVEHISLYPFRPTSGTKLSRLINSGKRDFYISQQKINFYEGRKLLLDSGYSEYASGYFGKPSLFNTMYFQMRGETIGMGSGASSTSKGYYFSHIKGMLNDYLDDPTRIKVKTAASEDPVIISSLRAGLSCIDGVLRDQWQRVTGMTLEESFERPVVKLLIDFLKSRGLIVDEKGARLPADKIGSVLIDLSYELLGKNHAKPIKIIDTKKKVIES